MGRPKKYTSDEERRRARQLANLKYRERLKDRQREEKTKGQKSTDKCVHKGKGSGNGGLLPQYSEFDFKAKVEQYFPDVENGLRPVVIPTMLDMAVYLDITYDTLLEYGKRDGLYAEVFSRAWDRCESALEQLLYREKGNPNGPLAVLNYRHGKSAKQEMTVNVNEKIVAIHAMADEELEAKIQMMLPKSTSSRYIDESPTTSSG
jgi:hypothetical protein